MTNEQIDYAIDRLLWKFVGAEIAYAVLLLVACWLVFLWGCRKERR